MNTNKDKIGTALAKELCLICAKEFDGPIIMNTRLAVHEAEKVNNLHGKVIGWKEKPCDKCKKMLDEAFLFIGIIESKTDFDNLPEGFYRSGHIIGVKKDIPLVQEFVKEQQPNALEKGYIFIPVELMKHFNLIK